MSRIRPTQVWILATLFLAAVLMSVGSPRTTYAECGLLADGWRSSPGDSRYAYMFAVATDSITPDFYKIVRIDYHRQYTYPGDCPTCSWSVILDTPSRRTPIGLSVSGTSVYLFYEDGEVYRALGIDSIYEPCTCTAPSEWEHVHGFNLTCYGTNAVPGDDPNPLPGSDDLLCTPNPAQRTVNVSFSVTQAASIDVSVFDVSGRLVKTIYAAPEALGSYSLKWDGKDNMSNTVPSGVYFIRLRNGRNTSTERVVMVD